jgi:3-dehydroquinate dehydratase type I
MRICIPIVSETQGEAVRRMNDPLPFGHSLEILFEVRVDKVGDGNFEKFLEQKRGKILVTNRRREEGGAFRGTERERISYLLKAVEWGADYVDIEASTDPALIAEIKAAITDRGGNTLLIVSYHDFEKTPPERSLIHKLEEYAAWRPDILKIVTFANTDEDNLGILRLIPLARKRGQEIISFCMGEKGRVSRVMSLLLGAYMGFASLDRGEESAPGQLSLAEMIGVLSTLGGMDGGIRGKATGTSGEEILSA